MSNKVVIGGDTSEDAARADTAQRSLNSAQAELTMIRRRIREFFIEVTQISFPASPPSWAEDWVEWLLTGEVLAVEEPTDETPAEEAVDSVEEVVIEQEVGLVELEPAVLGADGLLLPDEKVI